MLGVTAVVLCGGKGERMRPITDRLPKPLVPLNGTPILAHLLRYLSGAGIQRIVLCIGYRAQSIRQFVKDFNSTAEIVCVDSGDVGMTDRILDAREHVPDRALVCYGDTLANVDLAELLSFHEEHGAGATLTVYPMQSPFGVVEVNDSGEVGGFQEKPRLPYWINIGYLLCEQDALDQMERNSGIPEFFATLQSKGSLFAYLHRGKHLTINTEKDRQLAESEVTEFYTVIDPQGLVRR